ncbi:hypothetical protein ABE205_19410 [Brevibacillus agri]|uniref:hypothetical protein n=1 Tax=Brevibacillus agri TaxID=51101 RepID=UPI003D2454E1
MRGMFNITLDGREYGVLVSQSKYHRVYKMAKQPVKKETANLREELEAELWRYPELATAFINGESIKL